MAAPYDLDRAGSPMLVEVYRQERRGPRLELLALAEAVGGCECASEFLGLETLEREPERQVVESLMDRAERELVCDREGELEELVAALRERRIERALQLLENCEWTDERGAAGALDRAFQAADKEFERYHVCNNDALMQQRLWGGYRVGSPIPRCDSRAPFCSGPLWVYDPERPSEQRRGSEN